MRYQICGLLACLAQFSAAHAQEICSGLLSYAARDELEYSRDTATARSLYNEHCEGSTAKKSSQTNIGIEAVIKAVPIKFNLGQGSASEKLNTFCKIASDQAISNEKVELKRSTVVREALDAFNRCIVSANSAVFFDPIIGNKDVIISVSRGKENVEIRGINYSEKDLDCTISLSDKTIKADRDTRHTISDGGSVPIYCRRLDQPQSDGSIKYPATALTIVTNRTQLRVPVPEDAELPTRWATEIDASIKALAERTSTSIAGIEQRLDGTKFDCQSTSTVFSSQRNTDGQVGPALVVSVPAQFRSTHTVIGGSCEISKWYQDRAAFFGGGKTSDGQGWQCRAGDPPSLPRVFDMLATVHYCKIDTGQPK